ncbi:MAG: transposase [Limnochordia bacterium]|nr:transposase [Limnochordia bacterium]MDD2628999.1 transposase [Limnochordia bacterium]
MEARKAMFERIGWEVAERNDEAVAKTVANREPIDSVHNLDQAGLLDAFLAFLREIGFMDFLDKIAPSRRQRFIVPSALIILTYMVKTLLGIEHMYAMPTLLFTDPAMMRVMGFNARWIDEGLCRRSHEKRGEDKEPPKPFSAQMVANFIADLLVRESARFFNMAIRCLAKFGAFPSEVTLIIDGTDVETTAKCKGAGKVTRTKTMTTASGRTKSVEVEVFGFKAVVAYDLITEIPVAVIVTKIQRHDTCCTKRLIRQAEENLAPGGVRIAKVLVDRGFLDGSTMAWLDQRDIFFVVPARHDMQVYKAARVYAEQNRGYVQTRTRTVTQGHGKNRTKEVLKTEVIGIKDLHFWDSYNDPEDLKRMRRRGYRPKPINAVVVRIWDNKEYGPGGKVVYLTNQPVEKPLETFDNYDGRSLIENTLFREGKQAWALENIPQKNQRAAVAHIFITFAMVALTMAYRTWMKEEEDEESLYDVSTRMSRADSSDEPLGVRRWRRELKKAVADYVIVFQGAYYGIFHVMEFSVLAGYTLRLLPEELGTPEQIFARYGLDSPN